MPMLGDILTAAFGRVGFNSRRFFYGATADSLNWDKDFMGSMNQKSREEIVQADSQELSMLTVRRQEFIVTKANLNFQNKEGKIERLIIKPRGTLVIHDSFEFGTQYLIEEIIDKNYYYVLVLKNEGSTPLRPKNDAV